MSEAKPSSLPITTKDDGSVGCYGRGRCCLNNPGWFGPGEVEQAAEHLGIPPDELVRKYLVVVSTPLDTTPNAPMVDLFAPTKVDAGGEPLTDTGRRVPRAYQFMAGACIFYQGERCAIHPARPIECRRYFCEQAEELNMSRTELARLWWEAGRDDADDRADS